MKRYTITAEITFDDLEECISNCCEDMSQRQFTSFSKEIIRILIYRSEKIGYSKKLIKQLKQLIHNYS